VPGVGVEPTRGLGPLRILSPTRSANCWAFLQFSSANSLTNLVGVGWDWTAFGGVRAQSWAQWTVVDLGMRGATSRRATLPTAYTVIELVRPDLPDTHVIDLEGELSGGRPTRKGDPPESTDIDSGETR